MHEAYVDVESPSVDDAAAALPKDEPCVIVPILLSTGFHTPRWICAGRPRASGIERIVIAESLGPDSRLARPARTRLEEAGWTPRTVLSWCRRRRSSRADGRADMERAAELLSEALGTQVQHGFIASIDSVPRGGGRV